MSDKEKNIDIEDNTTQNFLKKQKLTGIGRIHPLITDDDYIEDRITSQIEWYNSKSLLNQKKYKRYKRFEFFLALSIPVLIGFSTMDFVKQEQFSLWFLDSWIQVIAAVSGVVLAFLSKILELEEYYKLWKDYRVIAEELAQEKMYYLTQTSPYDHDNAYHLLVQNIEGIINTSIQKWKHVTKQDNQCDKNKPNEEISQNQVRNTKNL